tara:strand:- start:385 stop:708 length:324 start_codon:yes stop_codon:yes gene_type:complete
MAVLQQDVQEKLEKHRAQKAEQSKPKEIKFTEQEITTIGNIKQNYDSLTLRMGQLHFELKSLTKEKENIENLFQKNRDEEVQFAQDLTTKYGKGSLDIETGIFTPSE